MAIILNIDTSMDDALISLTRDGEVLHFTSNIKRNDHAAWIHGAIQELVANCKCSMEDLNAVGICAGPGSYTGLRIGLSTAKGLCYALRVPLITVGTLEALAFSAIVSLDQDSHGLETVETSTRPQMLFSPMIDARRMEVFVAMYDPDLREIVKPHALILRESSFEDLLSRHKILFLGNGSMKFREICKNSQAEFKNIPLSPVALAQLIYRNFIGNNFAGLAYTEPSYLKEFFGTKPRTKQ
jgi:tRNA threonylcarbamoyladenosine biosynthesis protein TsaB